MTSLFCSKICFVCVIINLPIDSDCRLGNWKIYNENCCLILWKLSLSLDGKFFKSFDAFHTCLPLVTQCPSSVCVYRTAIDRLEQHNVTTIAFIWMVTPFRDPPTQRWKPPCTVMEIACNLLCNVNYRWRCVCTERSYRRLSYCRDF